MRPRVRRSAGGLAGDQSGPLLIAVRLNGDGHRASAHCRVSCRFVRSAATGSRDRGGVRGRGGVGGDDGAAAGTRDEHEERASVVQLAQRCRPWSGTFREPSENRSGESAERRDEPGRRLRGLRYAMFGLVAAQADNGAVNRVITPSQGSSMPAGPFSRRRAYEVRRNRTHGTRHLPALRRPMP